MAGELTVTQKKVANIRMLLERSKGQMAAAMPKHLTPERLLRVAMTSIQKTPKLLDCTPQSLLACVMTCAQIGLEPDQFLGQAYLVPFKDVCTLIPGYRGYIALARRSGEMQTVSAQVVYSNDFFNLQYGVDDKLEHRPPLDGSERGEVRGAYCVFKYKDGGYSFDFMSVHDIEKIRARSKASGLGKDAKKDVPWVTDWDEMAKKTVIKRHAKLAPLSVEFQRAVALEDRAMNGESQADLLDGMDTGIIEAETVSQEDLLVKFTASIPKDADTKTLEAFLAATAESNKTTVDAVKLEAVKDEKTLAGFWKFFLAYQKQQAKKQTEEPMAPGPCPQNPTIIYTVKHCNEICADREGCPAWG